MSARGDDLVEREMFILGGLAARLSTTAFHLAKVLRDKRKGVTVRVMTGDDPAVESDKSNEGGPEVQALRELGWYDTPTKENR